MLLLLAGAAWLAAEEPGPRNTSVAPSTKRMAALLAERAAAINPRDLWFNTNEKRVELFRQDLVRPMAPLEALRLRYAYASELLFSGRYADAVAQTDVLLEEIDRAGPDIPAEAFINVLMLKGLSFLRWGEEQNCAEGHNADSCLLPIRGGGVHVRREGATRALEVFERVMRIDPGNLRARWLLNIAHMTLGNYPDGVPAELRIGPDAFLSGYPLPRFENVASRVGLDIYGISGGAVVEDFDRDGLLDIMVSATRFEDQTRLFRNEGTGMFREVTHESGLTGLTGGLNMIHADYDNDGLPDVLILRGAWMGSNGRFPVSLLRNRGNMRFEDVTEAAGVMTDGPTQVAVWFDYDGDGHLDLFVAKESAGQDRFPCELYRNKGDGTFVEVGREVGADVLGYVKGAVAGDFDNDGRPDLFLSLVEARNVLLHNDGPQPGGGWRFTNIASKAGVEEPRDSFPAMAFDYDNDGWLDIFVAAYRAGAEDVAADYLGLDSPVDRGRLYRNRGDGTFEDVTKAVGLWTVMPVMGLNFGDLDNDGWLDFYTGTGNPDYSTLVPNRMFRNDRGKRFQDVTTAGNFGHLQKGHGIAFADVDNDGDQDVFEQMGGAYPSDRAYSVLFENPHDQRNSVILELEGTKAARATIGARIAVTLRTPSGTRRLHRMVGTGGSFGSAPLRQEIGIGDATEITAVEVRWPGSGTVQTFRGIEPGGRYALKEGAANPVPLERKVIRLARKERPHRH